MGSPLKIQVKGDQFFLSISELTLVSDDSQSHEGDSFRSVDNSFSIEIGRAATVVSPPFSPDFHLPLHISSPDSQPPARDTEFIQDTASYYNPSFLESRFDMPEPPASPTHTVHSLWLEDEDSAIASLPEAQDECYDNETHLDLMQMDLQVTEDLTADSEGSEMYIEGNTMASIRFDEEVDEDSRTRDIGFDIDYSRFLIVQGDGGEDDILPMINNADDSAAVHASAGTRSAAYMSQSSTDDFYEHLLSNLSCIPVPVSFTERQPDPYIFYVDVLEFIGFNREVSVSIANEVQTNLSFSLIETVTEWITRHWRKLSEESDIGGEESIEAIDAREMVASTYESIGIVKEFAYNCTTFIFLDPLRNIVEIMAESIKDVTTLRECYLNGLITRGGVEKGNSKGKETAPEGKGGPPPFDKTVTRKFVNGAFISIKDIDDSDPQPMYPVTTKWAYDENQYITGYRSFSQEAAVKFTNQGGFGPTHTYTQGDLYGMEPFTSDHAN